MSLLSRHQLAELARLLKAPLSKVQDAAHFISENLNPYPARVFLGRSAPVLPVKPTQVYYQPDMIITLAAPGSMSATDRSDGPLMVEIIMPLYGTLRVNPLYKQAMQESGADQKDALRDDLDRASLFVKCLQQRNHTIQRLMQRVVSLQRDFILNGEKYLHPVTRAQLAQRAGSTRVRPSRAR